MTAHFVELDADDPAVGFDAADPTSPWTLVPEDGESTCYLRGGNPSWKLHSTDPGVLTAERGDGSGLSANASDLEVILHGHDEGHAVLQAREGHHTMAHLRVYVASRRTIHVKFFFVKDATGKGPVIWHPAFAERALHRASFLYRRQANVTCHYYGHEHIEIPDLDFSIKSKNDKEKEQATQRVWDRLDDFTEESFLRVFYNVFCVPVWAVRDVGSDVQGTNCRDGNMCVIEDFITNQNHAVVLAHEMGHFLQHYQGHNNSNKHNLMHKFNAAYGGEVLHESEIKRIRRQMD